MQEEVAHCAAGVRWLTYLHSQACSAACMHDTPQLVAQLQNASLAHSLHANQPNVDTSNPHRTCSPILGPDRGQEYLASTQPAPTAAAAHVSEPMHQLGANGVSCSGQSHCAAPESATGSHARKATSGSAKLHDWQADAQQYSTVEEWFHALVRAHFKGSLKVCSQDYTLCLWGSKYHTTQKVPVHTIPLQRCLAL